MSNVTAYSLQERVPDKFEIKSAEQLKKILDSQFNGKESIKLPVALNKSRKEQLTLAPALTRVLLDILELVSNGKGITIIPVESEFTTQQAADFLNVSREYLNKLLEEKKIPYTLRERHRRIKIEDLSSFKRKQDRIRSEAMDNLIEMDSGLIFDE